jgi:hypothetical protein
MPLYPIDPLKALAFASNSCREHSSRIHQAATNSAEAKIVAKQMLADLALQHDSESIGVKLLKSEIAVPINAKQGSSSGDILEATAMSAHSDIGAPHHGVMKPSRSEGADQIDMTQSSSTALKTNGPSSNLVDCPYCDEPYRPFCPESGRRHETAEEKCQRMWRTLFRQLQFSAKMASAKRLEKPNTCAEEFYIEL